jgi:hypothetical protein
MERPLQCKQDPGGYQEGYCLDPTRVSRDKLTMAAYLPRPAWGERGGVRGSFFEFAKERLKNTVEILNNIIVPNADYSVSKGA